MNLPAIRRAFVMTLALWLPLFKSEAEWITRCPMHGGEAQVAAHDQGADASGVHDHDAEQSSPADHGDGHRCLCPGPGCCPPAVVLLPAPVGPLSDIVAVHEAAAVSRLELFSSDRDYVLPFATAPPALALAPAALSIA